MKCATARIACIIVSLFAARSALAQTVTSGPYYATPAWDQTLACSTPATCPRFIVLSNLASAAVLDRETGLVWEKAPSATPLKWSDAAFHCTQLIIGNRMGWRLPSIEELLTLTDQEAGFTTLPPGSPFNPVYLAWSSTLIFSTRALGLSFRQAQYGGGVGAFDTAGNLADSMPAWCVRGGRQGPISVP